MYRRQKYTNVQLDGISHDENAVFVNVRFDCCRDAAEWLVEAGYSKSVGAARVGMSSVLTGRRSTYRHLRVRAERIY